MYAQGSPASGTTGFAAMPSGGGIELSDQSEPLLQTNHAVRSQEPSGETVYGMGSPESNTKAPGRDYSRQESSSIGSVDSEGVSFWDFDYDTPITSSKHDLTILEPGKSMPVTQYTDIRNIGAGPLDVLESLSPGSSVGSGLNYQQYARAGPGGSSDLNSSLIDNVSNTSTIRDKRVQDSEQENGAVSTHTGAGLTDETGSFDPSPHIRGTQNFTPHTYYKKGSLPTMPRFSIGAPSRPVSGTLHIVPEEAREDDVFLDYSEKYQPITKTDPNGANNFMETSFTNPVILGGDIPSSIDLDSVPSAVVMDMPRKSSLKPPSSQQGSNRFLVVQNTDNLGTPILHKNTSVQQERRRTLASLTSNATDVNQNVQGKNVNAIHQQHHPLHPHHPVNFPSKRKHSLPVNQQVPPKEARKLSLQLPLPLGVNPEYLHLNQQQAEIGYQPKKMALQPNVQPMGAGHEQTRRPSKSYTVIHYGSRVGREACTTQPTGNELVDRLDFYDIEDSEANNMNNEQLNSKVEQKVILQQLSRQLSEDAQSVVSVTSGGGKGQRKRLLSVQHINHPFEEGGLLHNSSFDAQGDTTDLPLPPHRGVSLQQDETHITMDTSQETCDGSKMHHNKTVQAMAELGKRFALRKKNRLVYKDGSINVRPANISKRTCQFLLDIFTTLLDLSWRWVWALFVFTFVLSWLFFAVIWWLVCYANGDFEQRIDSAGKPHCVDGIIDFGSAFLFSVETQHTIGYGTRAVSTYCPFSYIVITTQSLLGVVIQCVMAGVVFAKLSKPKNRAETIMFSKRASVCMEDGCYCLVFRVGDMRRSQLVGCSLHAFLVREHEVKGGRRMEFQREPLEMVSEAENYDQYLFLAWPTKIIHRITSDSPLYNVSQESLLSEQFEIIIILEGTVESSGMITQIRTSYLPSEIEWGQRFSNLLTEQKLGGTMEIDYSNFSQTELQPNMPSVSALEHYRATAAVTTQSQRDRRLSHRSNMSVFRGYQL